MNNIEKLRNYFLGKDPQLKETMADNSLRLIGIEGKHFVLRTELLKRLIDLKKQVDDKDEELQANIDAVIEDLSGEQEARMAGDETLQENIDREAEMRDDADARLAADLHELDLTVDDILDWANTSEFIYANDLETRLLNYYTKAQVDELIGSTDWSLISNRPSINNFTQDLNLVDGTGSTGLTDGIYFTDNYKVYVNNVESYFFNHAVILSTGGDALYVISSPYNARQPLGFYEVYYNSQTNTWNFGYQGMQTDWSLINNKPAGLENYSTTEQVVGTWTDGKPLYQKVITGTCPTVTLDGNEAHTDFTIDNNVSYSFVAESFMEMGSTNYRTSFPYDNFSYDSTFQAFTHTYTNAMLINNIIRIRNSSVANSGKNFYLVVRYTKTTD